MENYDVLEEPMVRTSVYRRLCRPVAMTVSVMMATTAVYFGFIHSNETRVGAPVTISGKVQPQNGKPSGAVAAKPAMVAQQPPSIDTQQAAAAQSLPVNRLAASPSSTSTPSMQRRAVAAAPDARGGVATTPDTRRLVAAVPNASRAMTPAPAARPTIAAAPDARRSPGNQLANQPVSPSDKLRADAARHLKAARASLQANNLSAAKKRLAAAVAAQPQNHDAQRIRSAVNTREQQRDALLSLARGCGYVGRWACASHNAGIALEIDASSKEAQRLLTLATQQSELRIAPPALEPAPEPPPVVHDMITHH